MAYHMLIRHKCPVCGMVSPIERFALDRYYPLERIEQEFKGRGAIQTKRYPIAPWPALVEKLKLLLEEFSVP